MTIDQRKVIDFIGIDNETDQVVLTIVDHLEWDKNDTDHLLYLQEKINHYLAFIESGEIYKKYPQAKGKHFVIETISSYPLNAVSKEFYKKAKEIVFGSGFELKFTLQSTIKKQRYTEGTYFALPLRSGGFGIGLVVRIAPEKDGVIIGYFSNKRFSEIPKIEEVKKLAFPFVWRFGDLFLINNKWTIIGLDHDFGESKWPVPLVIRKDPLTKKAWVVKYGESNITRIDKEEPTDYFRTDLETDGLLGAGAVEIKLDMLAK